MQIRVLSIILIFLTSFSFASDREGADTTVGLTRQFVLQEELPNSNYIALNERNATRHFSKTIVLYNYLASKSLKKGASKSAEQTLLKKSIPLSLRYGTNKSDYDCFMALADIYVGQKKYSQAKWYYIQSNSSAKKGNYSQGEVLSLIKLAKVKRTIGDNSLALQDLKLAEKIAIKTKFKSSLPEIRQNIKAYSKKQPAKALASVKK